MVQKIQSKAHYMKIKDLVKKGEISSVDGQKMLKGVKYSSLPGRMNNSHIPEMWQPKKRGSK